MSSVFIIIALTMIASTYIIWVLSGNETALIISSMITLMFLVLGGTVPFWDKTVTYDTTTLIEKTKIGFVANPEGAYHPLIKDDYLFVTTHTADDLCIRVITRNGGLFPTKDTLFAIVELPPQFKEDR